ncbi:hypothetical protein BJV77DRAFT_1071656 [Russula vinacea]|nr:hypothetical protein BJV77DRAFT_1071656 [Russula vinacea]
MPSVSPYRRQALARSRPYATENRTAGSVASSRITRSRARYLAVADSQSDTDSTLRNSSSSNSSGSCTDDTVADATDSITLVSDLPQEFHKAYQELVPVLGYSDAQFTELEVTTLENTLSEIKALLRGVIGVGYSRQWAEFDKLLALRQRISDIIDAKKAAAPSRKIEVVDLQGYLGSNLPGKQIGLR